MLFYLNYNWIGQYYLDPLLGTPINCPENTNMKSVNMASYSILLSIYIWWRHSQQSEACIAMEKKRGLMGIWSCCGFWLLYRLVLVFQKLNQPLSTRFTESDQKRRISTALQLLGEKMLCLCERKTVHAGLRWWKDNSGRPHQLLKCQLRKGNCG